MIAARFEQSGLLSPRGELSAFAREVVACALEELGWPGAQLTVLFCSDIRMRRLNREFLGIDAPTDVLSFPAAEDVKQLRGGEKPYLGDIAIALPYTARNARKARRRPEEEVALLLVHGVLHLLGHDHDTAPRKRRMWREQERLLAATRPIRRPRLKISSAM